jgi:hypothetical protein
MRRWICHSAVGAWGLMLLAQPASPLSIVTLPEHAPEVFARVQPLAEEEPAPPATKPQVESPSPPPEEPANPEPKSTPPARAEAAPRRVEAEDLESGGALLAGGGGFPVLSFGYEDFASFLSYARSMTDLGARFVVIRSRKIVGSVDLETGATRGFPGGSFSPRARDYTGEPGLARLARAARESFGDRSSVMMLVPRQLDAGLFGGLARVLAERGEPHGSLREIRGRYERGPEGGVRLRLEGVVRHDGTRVPVDALFDLRQIVESAAT